MPDRAASEAVPLPPKLGNVRDWTISLLAIALTLFVGLLCVLLLASTLTQARLSGISVNGVNINIWKLDDMREQWVALRGQRTEQTTALTAAGKQKTELDKAKADAQVALTPLRTDLDAELNTLVAHVTATGNLENKDNFLAAMDMQDNGPIERLDTLESWKSKLVGFDKGLENEIKALENDGANYRIKDKIRLTDNSAVINAEIALTQQRKNLSELQESLDALYSSALDLKSVDDATRERIDNAMYELFPGKILGGILNPLMKTPSDVLTLVLVIAMGVLGSALQISHGIFTDAETQRIGAYFLQLSVGAITALVIFIVAKAGVPIVADATRLGGDAPINPYFVSFLAIISGLMSENAIRTVQAQGARFFGPRPGMELDRWARNDLRDAFRTAGRDPKSVGRLLDTEEGVLEGWISGAKPIPANAQLLIAGILGQSPRELFTDLPPEGGQEAAGA